MSAERYGGAYSPRAEVRRDAAAREGIDPAVAASPYAGRTALRLDLRARLMYLLPVPLGIAVVTGLLGAALADTALAAAGLAALLGGAWFLNEGQKAARAYHARAVARRPRVPRKIIAALLTGLGVTAAQLAGSDGALGAAAGFGLLATLAHVFAFGIDPLENKGIDLSELAEHDRIAGIIEHAEETLQAIEADARAIADREIERRLAALGVEVRAMLARVRDEPREMDRARRYLSVHLVGAREATRKYAESHALVADPTLREDYLSLLSELEASFARGRDQMLDADRTDLEVEIEVLRDRLGREHA